MENYVRRCTLFAIIGLIVGLLIIIGGSIHAQNRAVPSDAAIVAVKYVDIKERPVGVNPGVHPVKLVKKDAKIPDAVQPNRANVKPVAGRYASLIDRISADDKEELARLIYHESRGKGGEAVCETVFNRMLSDEFSDTVHEVIHQKNPIQFSPADILWTAAIEEPEALERCREIVDEVLYADDSNRFIPVDYCFFNSLEIRTPQDGDYEYGGNVFFKSYT